MWLRCVCGLSLRAAMSSIIRRRSGLTVLVSLIGRSFLSEVERPSILRTELPVAPSLSYRLATRPLGSRPPRSGPERSDFVPWRNPTVAPSSAIWRNPAGRGVNLKVRKGRKADRRRSQSPSCGLSMPSLVLLNNFIYYGEKKNGTERRYVTAHGNCPKNKGGFKDGTTNVFDRRRCRRVIARRGASRRCGPKARGWRNRRASGSRPLRSLAKIPRRDPEPFRPPVRRERRGPVLSRQHLCRR